MKRICIVFNVLFSAILFNFTPVFAATYDFGNYTSSVLVQKAWAALKAKDFDAAQVYANKTIELYSAPAQNN